MITWTARRVSGQTGCTPDMRFFPESAAAWRAPQPLPNLKFVCGYCDTTVSSIAGYKLGKNGDGSGPQIGAGYICPNCGGLTFKAPTNAQYPSPSFGGVVTNIPADLGTAYDEARRCTAQNCYTAAVRLCRKMLMNISVAEGAKEGLTFVQYVEFLANNGYVPPNGKHWVDHIRKKGNEATHQIALMGEADAHELLIFTEMLLRFIYEFPSIVPKPASP